MSAPIPRPDNWPPFLADPTPRDWTEDCGHENGAYNCRCCICGQTFIGYKRRVACRACHDTDQIRWNALTPEQQIAAQETAATEFAQWMSNRKTTL